MEPRKIRPADGNQVEIDSKFHTSEAVVCVEEIVADAPHIIPSLHKSCCVLGRLSCVNWVWRGIGAVIAVRCNKVRPSG